MLVSAKMSIAGSCISGFDQSTPIATQEIGRESSDDLALLLGHIPQKGLPIGIGDLIELPTQHGDAGFGIDPSAADVVMAKKLLNVGNIHADRQQTRSHGVPSMSIKT